MMKKRYGICWKLNTDLQFELEKRNCSLENGLKELKINCIEKCGIFSRQMDLFIFIEINDSQEIEEWELDNASYQVSNYLEKNLNGVLIGNGIIMDEVFYTDGYVGELSAFERIATYMKIKAGYEKPYRQAHENIWPSILEGIYRTKICNYSIFMKGTDLFSYFEVENFNKAMEELRHDEENQRWQTRMSPMMDVGSGIKENSSVLMQEILFISK